MSAAVTLLNEYPCLSCLSKSELEIIKLILWANAAGITLPAAMDTVLADSQEILQMSDTQMLITELVAMKAILLPESTFEQMVENLRCMKCIPPKTVRAATLLMTISLRTLQ
jgi:hypothetical protein